MPEAIVTLRVRWDPASGEDPPGQWAWSEIVGDGTECIVARDVRPWDRDSEPAYCTDERHGTPCLADCPACLEECDKPTAWYSAERHSISIEHHAKPSLDSWSCSCGTVGFDMYDLATHKNDALDMSE